MCMSTKILLLLPPILCWHNSRPAKQATRHWFDCPGTRARCSDKWSPEGEGGNTRRILRGILRSRKTKTWTRSLILSTRGWLRWVGLNGRLQIFFLTKHCIQRHNTATVTTIFDSEFLAAAILHFRRASARCWVFLEFLMSPLQRCFATTMDDPTTYGRQLTVTCGEQGGYNSRRSRGAINRRRVLFMVDFDCRKLVAEDRAIFT